MEYKFESIFYFADDNSPISVDYKTTPINKPFEIELLAFCLHVVRALLNTSFSYHGKNLCHTLTIRDSFRENFIFDTGFDLQPNKSEKSKRRIITNTIIYETKSPYFNMKIKGFGFFGEGATIGCAKSVGMFINLLFDKYKNNEHLLNAIIDACSLCATSIINKDTKILNQVDKAVEICDTVIKKSSL